jgi:hypothetical protein
MDKSAQACWSVASDSHFAIGTLKPVLGRFMMDSGKGLPGDCASIVFPAPPAKPGTYGPNASNNFASTNGVRSSSECPILA